VALYGDGQVVRHFAHDRGLAHSRLHGQRPPRLPASWSPRTAVTHYVRLW
jgi:hypothetical protein